MPSMSTALVLLNSRAAGGRAAALKGPLERWLAREALATTLLETKAPSEAQAAMRALMPTKSWYPGSLRPKPPPSARFV